MVDKKMLTVVEVLKEPAVPEEPAVCKTAHGSLLVGPTESFHWIKTIVPLTIYFLFLILSSLEEARISRRVSHDSHVKNNS